MANKATESFISINEQIEHAINDYALIEEGDRILAAVSGGKDSLTMLNFLCENQKRSHLKYNVVAIHIKTDFHCGACVHREILTEIFDKLKVKYAFKDIKVLDSKGKTNCFWCSWNRRKILFQTAKEMSCNKIAFGHHKDDIVETTLLNLFYNGEISGMKARQELFKGEIIIIRPLSYVSEDLIKRVAKERGFPEQLCQCPFGATSKRKLVKNILKQLESEFTQIDFKTNIFNGLAGLKENLCTT
jgi:tRNA 2-thiocytidine biosynthesis protein TtcA